VSAGTCYGFAVDSAVDLAYLRAGGGGGRLEIAVGTAEPEWSDQDRILEWDGDFQAQLYGRGNRFALWAQHAGWFDVDTTVPRIEVSASSDALRREERLWGIPALLCFAARGDLPLHAAAVDVDGKAIVVAAPRAFGKTTLAAGFVALGHRLLAEDLTCVSQSDGPEVVPGPAMLRLRRDVAERLEVPGTEVIGTDPERIHLALERSKRRDCTPVPLRAIVVLDAADAGAAFRPVEPADAIRDLLALSFRLPTAAALGDAFRSVSALVRDVPVVRVARPERLEDLPETAQRIVQDA
jgi:hypothetical protein